MSLRFAILAALVDGEASGYELAKRFDVAIANYWHTSRQQLYAELAKLQAEGLVRSTTVIQHGRPNKRLATLSEEGMAVLERWIGEPSKLASIKDDLLVKVHACDFAEAEPMLDVLAARRALHEQKLETYEHYLELLRAGSDEATFLRRTERVGPYLTLLRGAAYERENIAWIDTVSEVLRSRARERLPVTG